MKKAATNRAGDSDSIFADPGSVSGTVVDADDDPVDTIDLPFQRSTDRRKRRSFRERLRSVEDATLRIILIVILVLSGIVFVAEKGTDAAIAVNRLVKTIVGFPSGK